MSKTAQVAAALRAGTSVTRATSMVAFKIPNITAVIATLRRKGYQITTVTNPDDGAGSPYTKWVNAGPPLPGTKAALEDRIRTRAKRRNRV